jgi:Zn-dependent peptidase ImmA (M78 family)
MRGKADASKQALKVLKQFLSAQGKPARKPGYQTDVRGIAKHLGIEVVQYEFTDRVSGVFYREGEKKFLGVNNKHHEHRQRFTIAHEIAHYILHSGDVLHYDIGLESDGRFLYRAEDISSPGEIEANQFAAELLMPEDKVRELVDAGTRAVEMLAKKFEVSGDAMRRRLVKLGYL